MRGDFLRRTDVCVPTSDPDPPTCGSCRRGKRGGEAYGQLLFGSGVEPAGMLESLRFLFDVDVVEPILRMAAIGSMPTQRRRVEVFLWN